MTAQELQYLIYDVSCASLCLDCPSQYFVCLQFEQYISVLRKKPEYDAPSYQCYQDLADSMEWYVEERLKKELETRELPVKGAPRRRLGRDAPTETVRHSSSHNLQHMLSLLSPKEEDREKRDCDDDDDDDGDSLSIPQLAAQVYTHVAVLHSMVCDLFLQTVKIEKEIQRKIAKKLEQRLEKGVAQRAEEGILQKEVQSAIEEDLNDKVQKKLKQQVLCIELTMQVFIV